MEADHAAFIQANTQLAAVALRPDIQLHMTDDTTALWQKMQDAFHAANPPLPFWASAWAGGQALALYLLQHPETVAGKRVLDFASGSGLVAIAAYKAGAAQIDANDIDPFAFSALAMNAAVNHADIRSISGDIVGCPSRWDVVLAGDISYERDTAERVSSWLESMAAAGILVLIGDPGRTYLARDRLHSLARYDVPVSKTLEDAAIKPADVFCFKSATL